MDHYEELQRQLSVIRDRVRGVFYQQTNGLYLFGRPGTSKTHTVRVTLETLAAPYDYHRGHITPIGLFDLIATNRDRTIVLDDVASIFGSSGFRVGTNICTRVHNRGPAPAKRGVFAASVGVEVQSSAMKEDGRLQMVPIAEAIGVFLIV